MASDDSKIAFRSVGSRREEGRSKIPAADNKGDILSIATRFLHRGPARDRPAQQ
tara:strand:+ start:780 stop:941 length:162 start_codon:yes stop_codon:yes gene_type:complete